MTVKPVPFNTIFLPTIAESPASVPERLKPLLFDPTPVWS